jgi:outer membrane lipoprotein-sorting protein
MTIVHRFVLIIACAAALALAAPAPASAQRARTDASARQLVDHLYVISGQLPIQTLIVDMESSELINPKEPSGNLRPASKDKVFFKRPNKLHAETIIVDPGGTMDGKQFTIIRDGVNCWMFVPTGEYPVKKGADEPSPSSLLPFHIQLYAQDASKQFKLVARGDKTFGVAADVVRIADPAEPKASVTVWIDRTRWVPLAQEIIKPASKPGEEDVVKRILYKDFRQLKDGRYFPFRLEIYKGGVLTNALTYKAVGVNENLPDSLFEPMSHFIK